MRGILSCLFCVVSTSASIRNDLRVLCVKRNVKLYSLNPLPKPTIVGLWERREFPSGFRSQTHFGELFVAKMFIIVAKFMLL